VLAPVSKIRDTSRGGGSGGTENRTTTRRSRLQLFQGIGWQDPQQRRLGRFAAASPTTSAANVFVAELTEGVNGYWIDTTVLNWKSFGATVVGIMSCSVAHGTYAVGLSEGNVMSMGVLLDIGKKFCDGYVGRVVDLREVEDNCARIRNVIDAAKDAVHLR
jgi:hypothetical protein